MKSNGCVGKALKTAASEGLKAKVDGGPVSGAGACLASIGSFRISAGFWLAQVRHDPAAWEKFVSFQTLLRARSRPGRWSSGLLRWSRSLLRTASTPELPGFGSSIPSEAPVLSRCVMTAAAWTGRMRCSVSSVTRQARSAPAQILRACARWDFAARRFRASQAFRGSG